MQPVALAPLCQRLKQTFDLRAKEKSQTLIWQIDENIQLQGVQEELESAFSNLLDNAIKYTPEGGEIRFSVHQNLSEVTVSVKDNGMGIAAIHLDYLTERFYRVDKDRGRDTGGTGLGLAIVKHVLQRHQAQLVISSQPKQGSIFSCVFKP